MGFASLHLPLPPPHPLFFSPSLPLFHVSLLWPNYFSAKATLHVFVELFYSQTNSLPLFLAISIRSMSLRPLSLSLSLSLSQPPLHQLSFLPQLSRGQPGSVSTSCVEPYWGRPSTAGGLEQRRSVRKDYLNTGLLLLVLQNTHTISYTYTIPLSCTHQGYHRKIVK